MRDPLRSRWSWGVLLVLSIPFGWGVSRVHVANSLDAWSVEGDPALVAYEAFQRDFGNDEVVVVALESDAPPEFEAGLRSQPFVHHVEARNPRVFHVSPDVFPDDAARDSMLAGIRSVVRTQQVQAHLAGMGVAYQAVTLASHEDLECLLLPAAAACAVLLLIGLRRVRSVLVALAAMGISALWALGLFGLTGVPLNLVTTMVPTVVAVLGLANAMHLLRPRENGASILRACFYSALTSAAAFLALAVSDVRVLRELGLFAAAGVIGSFVVAALVTAPLAPVASRSRVGLHLEKLGGWVLHRRSLVAAVLVGLAVLAALGQRRLAVDTNTIAFLPSSHEVRRDSDWIEKHVGYYVPLLLRVDRPVPEGLLRKLEIPPELDGAQTAGPFVVVRTRMRGAAATQRSMDEAQAIVQRGLGSSATVRPAGYMPVYCRIPTYLGRSFLKSLPLAIALNFALLVLLLRSFKWALLGTLPNLLPVALLLGAMGWLGMNLDVAAISIACVAFGIVVDDTIHLLVQARASLASGHAVEETVLATLRHGGSAIFWTTIVLGGGFATFATAGVVPVQMFGTLLASTLIAGLACDLLLFPLLLAGRAVSPQASTVGRRVRWRPAREYR